MISRGYCIVAPTNHFFILNNIELIGIFHCVELFAIL